MRVVKAYRTVLFFSFLLMLSHRLDPFPGPGGEGAERSTTDFRGSRMKQQRLEHSWEAVSLNTNGRA